MTNKSEEIARALEEINYEDPDVLTSVQEVQQFLKGAVTLLEPSTITDKKTSQKDWTDKMGPIQRIARAKTLDIEYDFTKETIEALNMVYYLPYHMEDYTLKAKHIFYYLHDKPRNLEDCPEPERGTAPRSDDLDDDSDDDEEEDEDVTEIPNDASGVAHQLEGMPKHLAMFKRMIEGCEEWDSKAFLSVISVIKKKFQPNPTGKIGKIKKLTPLQYTAWSTQTVNTHVLAGPYLLVKYGQQNRALLKFSADGMTITSGDVTLKIVDQYELVGDCVAFAKNIKVNKKPVKYTPISRHAYVLAELFHRYYKIVNTSEGTLRAGEYTPSEIQRARLGNMPYLLKDIKTAGKTTHGAIRAALEKVKNEFNEAKPSQDDVDVVIEVLARICDKHTVAAKIDAYLGEAHDMVEDNLDRLANTLDAAAKLRTPMERATVIRKTTDCVNLKMALESLDVEREHRNITNIMQYSYKNMGSVGGNNSIPAVDTILKGARIKSFVDVELGIEAKTTVMYGVAYGHMIDAFEEKGVTLQLIDKDPKNLGSTRHVQEGDIYAIAKDLKGKKDILVIDDTMTDGAVTKKDKARLALAEVNISEGQVGDWEKMRKFVQLDPSISIISKISARNYNKAVFDEILYTIDKDGIMQPRWKHTGMYKFGKLHNPEVFLVLTNNKSAPEITRSMLEYHNINILNSIAIANKAIKSMADEATPNGTFSRPKMNAFWLKLVDALPIKWPWYRRIYNQEVQYGSSLVAGINEEDEYANLRDIASVWKDKLEDEEPQKPAGEEGKPVKDKKGKKNRQE